MRIQLQARFGDYLASEIDGRDLGAELHAALIAGEEIVLDFSNVRAVLSAFLNPSVGELYKSHPIAFVDSQVRAENQSEVQKKTLERVRAHARRYYHDPSYRAAQDAAREELFAG